MLNFKQLQLLSRTGYLIGLILLGLAGLHACSTHAGLFAQQMHPEHPIVPATVERVIDGDTLQVRVQPYPRLRIIQRVRILGIDAPETYRPNCPLERELGEAATKYVRDALLGERVLLSHVRFDSFGRLLAVVTVDGEDFAATMIASGHATEYSTSNPTNWCVNRGDG